MATDEHLLDLALEAFAERGYEGMSVRDLCRTLGVSHNLVHQRFGSKEQLWYAAVDHGFGSLAARLAEAVNDRDHPDDLARLRAVLVRFVEVTAAAPALLRVINQEGARPGPRLDHIASTFIQPAMAVVGSVLDRLHADGKVRRIPLASFYFLLANGAAGPFVLPALAGRLGSAEGRGSDARDRTSDTDAEGVVAVLFDGLVGPPS